MIRIVLPVLLVITPLVRGQSVNLESLRNRCIPDAPLSTLVAIVNAESNGDPNAMQIDFPKTLLNRWGMPPGTINLQRQPKNSREAAAWLTYFRSYGVDVDLGLMQVSTAEASRRRIAPESLLDPCRNLQIGWRILEDDYRVEARTSGPGREALDRAISRYNTGDPFRGIANGYLNRVLSIASRSSGTGSR